MRCYLISAPCANGISLLDSANTAGFTVQSGTGQDASDILRGSGTVYTPTLDNSGQTKVIFETVFSGGITGLLDFSLVVRGGVTVKMDIYGPQGFQYFWNEVYILTLTFL